MATSTFSSGPVRNLAFTENLGIVKELINQDVNIYKMTTLTAVNFDDDSLDDLEEKLSKRIPDCSSVLITLINNEEYMPMSLKVQIKTTSNIKNKKKIIEKKEKFVFVSVSSIVNKDNVSPVLPLLCVLSGKELSQAVQEAFEATFGCIITTIKAAQHHLKWLIAISINEIFKRKKETELSLVYEVQPDMHFSCNVPFGELHYLWRSCGHTNTDTLELKDMDSFFAMWTSHFENAFKVKVSWFHITDVVLSNIKISAGNEININCSMAPLLYCILSFIQSNMLII